MERAPLTVSKKNKIYCNVNKKYYNAYLSRFYYAYDDINKCSYWIGEMRNIWKGKDVVIVEGERTHNGVGNDFLETAASVRRIIDPSNDAYEKIDEIYKHCLNYSKDSLFLVSLGVAANFLVEKLYLAGYRALDIGNLDKEYEWYLHGNNEKKRFPNTSALELKLIRKQDMLSIWSKLMLGFNM